MFLNLKSKPKLWITTKAYCNVWLRLGKDLSLETKKLLMSHCFVHVKCKTPWFVIITLTLQSLGNNSEISKGDSDNNDGVLHYDLRFQTFKRQYQGVASVTLSKLGCRGYAQANWKKACI